MELLKVEPHHFLSHIKLPKSWYLKLEYRLLEAGHSNIWKEGANIHVHAIGDRAIINVLDAFEYSQNKNKSYHRRHVISHAQLVHPKDLARFKKLGVIASFQALWAYRIIT